VAVGRNYASHAKELNNPIPSKPFFFLKPTSSYLLEGSPIEIPKGAEVHHELELGVVIGKKGRDISEKDAFDYISGYTVALDMTARNFQLEARKQGMPWSAAKGYDTFCPVSSFIPKERLPDPHNINLWLKVNDEIRQKGNTSDMLFNIPQLLSIISSIMTLEPGDLVLTGTPEGVNSIKAGDVLTCGVEGVVQAKFLVEDRK
jgi:acylpyruvate hydrolase